MYKESGFWASVKSSVLNQIGSSQEITELGAIMTRHNAWQDSIKTTEKNRVLEEEQKLQVQMLEKQKVHDEESLRVKKNSFVSKLAELIAVVNRDGDIDTFGRKKLLLRRDQNTFTLQTRNTKEELQIFAFCQEGWNDPDGIKVRMRKEEMGFTIIAVEESDCFTNKDGDCGILSTILSPNQAIDLDTFKRIEGSLNPAFEMISSYERGEARVVNIQTINL